MDGGAWKAAVHGVTEGRTRLSDFTFTFHFHESENKIELNGKKEEILKSIKPFKLSKTIKRCFDHQKNH